MIRLAYVRRAHQKTTDFSEKYSELREIEARVQVAKRSARYVTFGGITRTCEKREKRWCQRGTPQRTTTNTSTAERTAMLPNVAVSDNSLPGC
jgi:hypothetical protein